MSAYDEKLAAAIAAAGVPLSMPIGSEPRTLDRVEDELTGARLSLYEEELETARLRLALKAAQRGRREARAQVAELEALDLGAVDGRVSATCEDSEHPTWLRKPDDARGCPWCRVAELEHAIQQMRDGLTGYDCPPPGETPMQLVTRVSIAWSEAEARVVELETERHSTNESLSKAAEALRENHDRIAELEQRYLPKLCGCGHSRLAHTTPPPHSCFSGQIRGSEPCDCAGYEQLPFAEAERLVADRHAAQQADAITRQVAPLSAMREDAPLKGRARLDATAARDAEATHWKRLGVEDPHDSALHHSYRVGRDLPAPDGA